MWVALFESAFQFTSIATFYICRLRLAHLFSYTVYYTLDPYLEAKSTGILLLSGIFICAFTLIISVLLNTALCVDLILMVRYPFEDKESRVKKYVLISVLLAITPTYLLTFHPNNTKLPRIGAGIVVIYVVNFVCFFAISVCYTFNKLRGPGFSKEVRYLALKRHIITASFYLIANIYIFANFYTLMVTNVKDLEDFAYIDTWWSRSLKIIFACQGFAIPLLRLSEPYFYQIVANNFALWWFTATN